MNNFYWLFSVSTLAWLVFELWIRLRERGQADTSQDQNTRRMFGIYVILAIIVANLFANFPYFAITIPGSTRFMLGTVIVLSGLALRIWSVKTLGNFFRTTVMIQKNHTVVENGPYKFIRHPSYTAILIILFGIGLATGNWIGLISMELIMLYVLHKRIRVEEKVLSSSLGEKYLNYMKHTKQFIPFIY